MNMRLLVCWISGFLAGIAFTDIIWLFKAYKHRKRRNKPR